MFDDQPINNNQPSGVPNNLPVDEPEDMFAGVEKEPVVDKNNIEETNHASKPLAEVPTSAVEAGILKPKNDVIEESGDSSGVVNEPIKETITSPSVGIAPPPTMADVVDQSGMQTGLPNKSQDVYKIKEPSLGNGIVKIVITIIIVIILGGGSWWIYDSFIKDGNTETFSNVNTGDNIPNDNLNKVTVPEIVEPVVEDVFEAREDSSLENEELLGNIIDEQVLFGEPIDKDADGLDDDREKDIGTDPNNWDTDGDELGDGDEVTIWKTDPLNPDSDGDTFIDGQEVKNGYNPAGPGKLFEPPTDDV